MTAPVNVLSYLNAVTIRTLCAGELPPFVTDDLGLVMTKPQHDWIWIAEIAGQPCGMLVAAPCHGAAIILRLYVKPDSPSTTVLQLLRQASRDAKHRGYPIWFAFLDVGRPIEAQLMQIAKRFGAHQWPHPHLLVTGLTGEH